MASFMIEDSTRIDYEESGSGPSVVLVPGSCSTGAAWRPIIERWGNRFRCVTTSLRGRRNLRTPHRAGCQHCARGRGNRGGHSQGGRARASRRPFLRWSGVT